MTNSISPCRPGDAFVKTFGREPATSTDAAWMNGYAAAFSEFPVEPKPDAHHCPTCVCPDLDKAMRSSPDEKCTCGKLWWETLHKDHRPGCPLKAYS